ncbi:MAG TPA: response regulator [Chitinophagaceae bacterium]|nr:response regulator [Chitinophagaceae bacterium]
MHILIADQFENIRKGIKRILLEEFPSARIDEAADWTELESKIGVNGCNLLVADFTALNNGADELQQLRRRFPALPIVAMGIHSAEYYARTLVKAGANDYLRKDIAPEELVKTVNRVLSGG